MDANYTVAMIEMGRSLAELVVKGSASAINAKVKKIKEEKTLKK